MVLMASEAPALEQDVEAELIGLAKRSKTISYRLRIKNDRAVILIDQSNDVNAYGDDKDIARLFDLIFFGQNAVNSQILMVHFINPDDDDHIFTNLELHWEGDKIPLGQKIAKLLEFSLRNNEFMRTGYSKFRTKVV